jgi:MFS family permease
MNTKSWAMFVWLLLIQLFVAFVGRSAGPLAPFLEKDFHISKAELGLLPAALFVGQSLVSIPAGWYADQLGARKMILILSFLLSISFFVVCLVPWFYVALFFVVIGD